MSGISIASSPASAEVSSGIQAKVVKSASKQHEAVVGKLLSSIGGVDSGKGVRSEQYGTGQKINIKA